MRKSSDGKDPALGPQEGKEKIIIDGFEQEKQDQAKIRPKEMGRSRGTMPKLDIAVDAYIDLHSRSVWSQ